MLPICIPPFWRDVSQPKDLEDLPLGLGMKLLTGTTITQTIRTELHSYILGMPSQISLEHHASRPPKDRLGIPVFGSEDEVHASMKVELTAPWFRREAKDDERFIEAVKIVLVCRFRHSCRNSSTVLVPFLVDLQPMYLRRTCDMMSLRVLK